MHLFALTPTGLWLRETLTTVFGINERLETASADRFVGGAGLGWTRLPPTISC